MKLIEIAVLRAINWRYFVFFKPEQMTPPTRPVGAFSPPPFFDWYFVVCLPSAHVMQSTRSLLLNLMHDLGFDANASIES
jgi:hypothetical protein